MSAAITIRSSEPVYYHREYKNDIPDVKPVESQDSSSWADQCERVVSVALPFFSLYNLSLGRIISTGHNLIIDIVHLIDHLQKGEHQKAMKDRLGIINNALYLALFLYGGLEIAIVSLAMQILIELYHSQAEFKKGRYIEGVGHLLMSMVRSNQLAGQMRRV